MSDASHSRTHAPGFTIIELLVVITIIAILMSLTLAAGSKVVSVGRERGTQWAMQSLDTSISEYIQSNGSIPPATVRDPTPGSNMRMPIVDGGVGLNPANLKPMDSTAWFIYQLQSEGSSALASIHQIDPKLRKTGIANTDVKYNEQNTGARTTQILDVWGNPIRYVHPRFGGVHGVGIGQADRLEDVLGVYSPGYGTQSVPISVFSRDPAPVNLPNGKRAADYKNDSDGGAPPNRRPYFYSAGPDGDPSTTDDNVYTTRPNLPR